jgi:anti-sigma regulatory factor (Ser/Thr protein kinase)
VRTILQLRTDSHPESLGHARRQVRDTVVEAGLAADAARNLEIAVGELLANVYQHAYPGRIGPVFVEVLTAPEVVMVTVRDEGAGSVPPAIPATLPPGSARGGRGLYLVERLVDACEITVNPAGHGVSARVTARLPAQ